MVRDPDHNEPVPPVRIIDDHKDGPTSIPQVKLSKTNKTNNTDINKKLNMV